MGSETRGEHAVKILPLLSVASILNLSLPCPVTTAVMTMGRLEFVLYQDNGTWTRRLRRPCKPVPWFVSENLASFSPGSFLMAADFNQVITCTCSSINILLLQALPSLRPSKNCKAAPHDPAPLDSSHIPSLLLLLASTTIISVFYFLIICTTPFSCPTN